jgi:RsiW-degrading membrane proteinase PrsW (M82 family)
MTILLIAYVLLASFLYRYFARGDRGEKEPRRALRAACLFGVLAVLIAGSANSAFLPSEITAFLDAEDAPRPSLEVLLKAALTVGVIEETLKFIPLALYIYKKRYFNEMTDGVIYFALAGMWFGVIESIGYAMAYGTEVGFMRIILAPFLHAGFSSLAGMGLIKFKLTRNPAYLLTGLGAAILLHGMYDFFLFSQDALLAMASLGIAAVVNFIPFRKFRSARRHDERLGLSNRHE